MAIITISSAKQLLPPEAVLTFSGGSTAPISITGAQYTTQLDATGSNDPDGTLAGFVWFVRKDGGAWTNIGSSAVKTKSHTISSAGAYDYKVKVIDNDGLEDESNIITVNFTKEAAIQCDAKINGNNFQTFWPTPVDSNFALDGTGSTPGNSDATIISYDWLITTAPSGSTAKIKNTTASKTTVGPLIEGNYFVKLIVKSSNGTTDNVLVEIRVKQTDSNGNYI
jgi:hypothetical protein